ncbi:UDP-glycosyltransferase 88F3-like [Abrus precatorius]|uniref:Glycosyltransferase n=1 Tax=Abrus precatorius TaxID=3816 RepID=A0A8B8MLV7_ABRPR|nr:UDP-glycosyltransferase 88F3-like [Abrus precatorius]
MQKEERIVLYPAPGIGHIISMVELAKHLNNRYSITILLFTGFRDHPSIDSYIHRISTTYSSITFHRLPQIPFSTSPTTTVSSAAIAFDFVKRNAPNVTTTLTLISQSSTIKSFIIDLFCTSALEPASSMGIPVYYFFTSGAAVLALFSYFPIIHERYATSFKDMFGVELRVPGNAPLKAVNMPEPMLVRDDPSYWDMLWFCKHLPKARGIIVNTFGELEPLAVKAITEGACFPHPTRAPPVYYIGPLIAEPQQSGAAKENEKCLSWVDAQPSRSVVYLCFGSRGSFSMSQVNEIARGLERSGHRFLWVLKTPTQDKGRNQVDHTTEEFDVSSVLPRGFMERTKGRGLVVKSWAPQVEVLSRDSVGGFVTHCGWNSVLEGVVAGVPMVAWPLYAEQHVNRHVMVEEMRVAIAVEQREGDGLVSAVEVETKVRVLMEREELRVRSLKVKEMALEAVGEFGSSTRALANLVHSMNCIKD